MKATFCLIVCLLTFFVSVALHSVLALDGPPEPLISLTVTDEPLGDVLDTINRETGYQFNLDRKWQDHPVSASINNLPLEQGLRRLLRSLNHSIIWESDKILTIMVFGSADSLRPGAAISFGSPPQAVPEEVRPSTDFEPDTTADSGSVDTGAEAVADPDTVHGEVKRDQGDNESGQETGSKDVQSVEVQVQEPLATERSSGQTTAGE